MGKQVYFALALLCAPSYVFAQESATALTDSTTATKESRGHQDLQEVWIHENRLQASVFQKNRNIYVLDQKAISALPCQSINELLSYVTGVDIRQRGPWGAQSDVSMDGGTFDQTLVMVNGIKISDPQTGHNMMNVPIPLDAIERIEVVRGPAARTYGINALNGAINIITKDPQTNFADVHLYTGSSFSKDTSDNKLYGGVGAQATFGYKGTKAQHLLSIGGDRSSGYRYNSSFGNNKSFYQATYKLNSNDHVSVMGGYIYNKFGANGFYSAPGDVESEETVQTGIVGIDAQIQLTPIWTLKPRVSYRYNHDEYVYIRQKPEVYRNRHETHVASAELNNTIRTAIGTLGLGLEARNEIINSSNLGNWDRSHYGFFGEMDFSPIKRLRINIGAYANYSSPFGWSLLPGADIGYELCRDIKIFANAGAGQRLPTYTDWYYKGYENIGNPQLGPERAINLEAGIKQRAIHGLQLSSSVFVKRTYDFIDWVKDELTDPWQPRNFHTLYTKGFTFTSMYQKHLGAPQQGLDFSARLSYTYLHSRIDHDAELGQAISRYALENLRHQIGAILNATYGPWGLTLAGRYHERINYKSYFLLDGRASYSNGACSLYVDLSNLLDVQYIEAGAVPMPGRWASLGFRYRLSK